MHYPWHPWHGEPIWILAAYTRGGVPVYHCSLDPTSGKRLLEIPQWMFDARVACLTQLVPSPIASCTALQEVKALVSPRRLGASPEVVQAQHQSLCHAGGSDAKLSDVTQNKPTPLFHPPVASPRWSDLPEEVRRRTLVLLVRWLRAHAGGGAQGTSREVADE